jgi:hypothetical protein
MAITRYTAQNLCPVCDGHKNLPAGQGIRCTGFLSEDGLYARCSREQHAGSADCEDNQGLIVWVHWLGEGVCRCGNGSHGQSSPAQRPSSNGTHNTDAVPSRIVAIYDYKDLDGKVLYQVIRKEPKGPFPQRHPCPDKGIDVWNLGGDATKCSCPTIGRILYRWQELMDGDSRVTVFIPEGEKDTDRLWESGLVATNNSGGAKKWEAHYGDQLAGRDVVVLPDNDQPGHDHGQQVAQMLHSKARSIKVLNLPNLPPNGGDVSDWLDKGGTVDELLRLAKNAEEWVPTDAGRVANEAHTLIFRTAADIAASTPVETLYIAKPWVPEGALVEFSGKIKQGGKTTWVMAMSRKVLDGLPFMGEPTIKTPVVYLTEQNRASLRAALGRADLLNREDFYILAYKDAHGTSWPDVVEAAAEKCKEVGARLLVVDTVPQWAGLQGTSENDSGAALEALAPLQVVAGDGIGVVCIRHDGKSDRTVGDSGRGSSAWGGGVDSIISIRRPEGNSSPTTRVLHCIGRFDELPEKLVIDLDTVTGEYRAVGSETELAVIDAVEAVKANAPGTEDEAMTEADLFKDADVKRTTGREAILELLRQGGLRVAGAGKKGDAKRYWAPESDETKNAEEAEKLILSPIGNGVATETILEPQPLQETVVSKGFQDVADSSGIHSVATPTLIATETIPEDSGRF